MKQNAQIIMKQFVHYYSLTTGGPGPVNAQIAQKRGDFYFPSFSVLEMLMQEFLIGILKCFCIIVLNIAVKSCQILDNVAAITDFAGK